MVKNKDRQRDSGINVALRYGDLAGKLLELNLGHMPKQICKKLKDHSSVPPEVLSLNFYTISGTVEMQTTQVEKFLVQKVQRILVEKDT